MYKLRRLDRPLIAIKEIPSIVISDDPEDGAILLNFIVNAIGDGRICLRNRRGLVVRGVSAKLADYELSAKKVRERFFERVTRAKSITDIPMTWEEATRAAKNDPTLSYRPTRGFALGGFLTPDDITQFLASDGLGACWIEDVEENGTEYENADPQSSQQTRLLTKREILSVDWPMPQGAPPMENIIHDDPKWVHEARKPIGARGKGPDGSHLWNPAILAFCCCNSQSRRKWKANPTRFGSFLESYFPDFHQEWETIIQAINPGSAHKKSG